MSNPPVPDPSLWATNPSQAAAEDAAIDAQTTADAAATSEALAIGTAENVAADILPVAAAAASIADPAVAPAAIALEPLAAATIRAQPDAVLATQNATAKTVETIASTAAAQAITEKIPVTPAPKGTP